MSVVRPVRLGCLLVSAALAACSARVDPQNPFDPATPDTGKAPATVRGKLHAASIADPTGLAVALKQNNAQVQLQTTAAEGAFVFSKITPGVYSIEASVAGFVPLTLPLALAAGTDLDLGVVELTELSGASASVVGGVVTLTGQTDHSGTLVEAVGRAFTAVTDSSGAWRLELVAGTYTLRFSHKDYVTTTASNVVLATGEQKQVAPFALLSNPATLGGRVEAEKAAGGQGALEGASVTLEPSGINTTTSATGAFTLSGIPAGSYLVRVQKAGYVTQAVAVLALLGGETRALSQPVVLPLGRGALLGKVTLAGATDFSGVAVALAPGGRTQLTGADGLFSFENLVAGTYELSAARAGWAGRVLGSNFIVGAGQTLDAGSFSLLADPASVALAVEAELEAGGSAPVEGALCSVDGTSVSGVSDAAGKVALGGIPPGSYAVRCAKSPFGARTLALLDLRGGEARTVAEALVLPLLRGAIAGTVLLAGRTDHSGTRVELVGAGRAVITGSTGAFRFDALPVGSYTLAAQAAGFQGASLGSFAVQADHLTPAGTRTLAADPASVSGTVLGELKAGGSAPLVDATCALEGTSFSAQSGAAGAFTISGVPVGSYSLRCSKATFAPRSAAVLSLAGGEARALADPLVLPLQRGAVAGTVRLADRLSDASGIVVEIASEGLAEVTAVDGSFRFDGLVVGSYTVTARREGYLGKTLGSFVVAADLTTPAGSHLLSANPATVTGHVDGELISGGKGVLPNASLTVDGHPGLTTTTDNAGDFVLGGLPAGSYVLRAAKTGFRDGVQTVLNLEGGEARPLPEAFSLALARGALAGAVALSDTSDASGAVVELTGTGLAAVTPTDGSFRFDGLLPGTYEVSARRDGYGRRVVGGQVVVADGVLQVPLVTLPRQGGALAIAEAPFTTLRAVHLVLQAQNATGYHASEDPTFTDPSKGDTATSTWHAFTPGTPVDFTLTDKDDLHQVTVVFFDGANVSAPASGTVTLDRQAPAAPQFLLDGGAAFTKAANGQVSVSLVGAEDAPATPGAQASGLARMHFSNFADFSTPSVFSFNFSQTWTLDTPSVDGIKTVYVKLEDRAGNLSAVAPVSILLDTLKPSSPALALTGSGTAAAGWTASPVVTAALSAFDANAGPGNQDLQVRLANESGFVGAAWQPFAPTVTWFLLPGDGSKRVFAQFRDPAGNESLVVFQDIVLDSSGPGAPVLSIAEQDSRPANGFTNNPVVKLTLSAAGGAVSAKVAESPSLAGATTYDLTTATMPVDFTLSAADGAKTLWARFTDVAGNTSDLAQASVTLDRTPPAALAPTLSPASFAGSTAVVLTAPAAGQDEVRVTGGGTTAGGAFVAAPAGAAVPVTLSGGEGTKALTVTWRDLADNTASVSSSLLLDTTAPAASNFAVTGTLADGSTSSTLTTTTGVTLNFSAQGDGAGSGIAEMMISNDPALAGAVFQPFTASAAVPWTLAPGDGAKTVYAKFKDRAGNVTAAAVQGTITLDSQAPGSPSLVLLEGDGRENGRTKSLTVTARLNASGAPVRALVGEDPGLAGAAVVNLLGQTLPFDRTFSLGGTGARTVYARFFDAAGNGSAAVAAQVVVDQTPPVALVPTLVPSGATASATIQLVPPAAGQDEVQLTGNVASPTGFVAATAGVPIPVLLAGTDGPKTINVQWRDLAENATSTAALSIKLDTTPPAAVNFTVWGALLDGTPSTTLTATPAVVLDFSGQTDATTGIVEMKVSNDPTLTGATFQPFSASVPWTLLSGAGAKTVYAQFKDGVGWLSAIVQGTIDLDQRGPGNASITITEHDVRPNNGYTSKTDVTLTLSANGSPVRAIYGEAANLAGAAQVAMSGASPSVDIPTFLLGGVGTRTVYAKFYDAAGNESQLVSASVVVDQLAPQALAAALTPSGFTNSENVTFTPPAAGQDEVLLGGAGLFSPSGTLDAPAGVPIPLTLTSGDGLKTVTVKWRDYANNLTTAPDATIVLDKTAPLAVPFTIRGSKADGTSSTSTTASLNVALDLSTQSDATSGIAEMKLANDSAQLANTAWQTFSSSTAVGWTLAAGDSPAKQVFALFRDRAGNANSSPVAGTIALDTTPPGSPSLAILENDGNENGQTASTTVTLRLNASGAPASALVGESATLAGATLVDLSAATLPFDQAGFVLGGAGLRTVYAQFLDAAGNKSQIVSAQVTVDQTAPSAVLPATSAVGGFIPSTTFQITIPSAGQTEGQLTGAALVSPLGFQPVVPGATANVQVTAGDGPKTLAVAWRDGAGNTTNAGSLVVTLDTTKPAAANFSILGALADGTPSSTLTATPNVVLDFSGEADANGASGSGIAEMKISQKADLAGATYQPFVALVPWALAGTPGNKVVYARFKDRMGWESDIVSGAIDLDLNGPPQPAISIDERDSANNGFTKNTQVTLVLSAGAQAVEAFVAENPDLIGATQFALTTNPRSVSWTLTGQGLHSVYVKYRDLARNESELVHADVVLDTTAPAAGQGGTLSPSTGYTASRDVFFVPPVTASPDFDEVSFSGDVATSTSGWYAAPPGVPVALKLSTGNALKTVTPAFADLAENVTTQPALAITFDNVAPALNAATFAVSGKLGDGTDSVAQTATTGVSVLLPVPGVVKDALSGLADVRLTNAASFTIEPWQPFAERVPWTLDPVEGTKTVRAQFRDLAGNVSLEITGAISLVTTPPSGGSLVIDGGNTATNKVSPTTLPLAIDAVNASEMAIFVDKVNVTGTVSNPWVAFATSAAIALPAGDGLRTVTVRFRNAARVEGGSVSANITLDTTAPGASTVTLVATRGDGSALTATGSGNPTTPGTPTTLVASAAAQISVTNSVADDVTGLAVVQTSPTSTCTAALGGSPAFTNYVAGSSQALLLLGEGPKRLCVALRDRAGNFSTASGKVAGLDLIVDLTPPSNPSFTNIESGVTNADFLPASGAPAITPVTDNPSGPVTYQCLGGNPAATGWYDCFNPGAPTFQLARNSVNTIGVRARDAALNASPGSFISVRHDSVPPRVPVLTKAQGNFTTIELAWDPPTDTGFVGDKIVGYRVNYGLSPGDTAGTGAAQGASPVSVGNVTSFKLTSLVAQTDYYVSVEAVDAAGNLSGPTGERLVLANRFSPRVLSSIGGELRQLGNVVPQQTVGGVSNATTSNLFVATNEGVIKLNFSTASSTAPFDMGRVHVPEIIPDTGAHMPVLPCTLSGAKGYCMVPVGATPEGVYLADTLGKRAGAPVVFFPNVGGTVAAGRVPSVLPDRPFRAAGATLSSKPVVFSVSAKGVAVFSLENPREPLLIAADASVLFSEAAEAGVIGASTKELVVWGTKAGDTARSLFRYDVTNVLANQIGVPTQVTLKDAAGNAIPADAAAAFFGGVYIFHKDFTAIKKCQLSAWGTGATAVQTLPVADLSGGAGGGPTSCAWQSTAGTALDANSPAGSVRLYGLVSPFSPSFPIGVTVRATGSSLDAASLVNIPMGGSSWGADVSSAVGHAGTTTGNPDYLFGVETNPTTGLRRLRRWEVTNPAGAGIATSTISGGEYEEISPDVFAEKDNMLFVASAYDATLAAVDLSNPLLPAVAQRTTTTRSLGTYTRLVVHGQYLYALLSSNADAGTRGFDVFRIYSSGSTPLTYLGNTTGATLNNVVFTDLAITGRYAFGVRDTTAGIVWIDLIGKETPSSLTGTSTGTQTLRAIAARPGTESSVHYDLLYAVDPSANPSFSATFYTYRFNVSTHALAVAGSSTLPIWSANDVTLSGDFAYVSGPDGAAQVGISSSASPSVGSGVYPLGGPVLSQGGYVASISSSAEPNGPFFTLINTAGVDGYLPFSRCSASTVLGARGSFTHRDGVYAASCNGTGIVIFTAVDPSGGKLFKRNDINATWPTSSNAGAALVTDGMQSMIAGANSTSSTAIYYSAEFNNAVLVASVPIERAGLPVPGTAARWATLSDGLFWVAGINSNLSRIYGFEWWNLDSGAAEPRGGFTFTNQGSYPVPAPPVGDGEFVLALSVTSTGNNAWIPLDVRDPDAVVQTGPATADKLATALNAFTLTWARQRAYVGFLSTGVSAADQIEVWETPSIHNGVGLTARTTISLTAAAASAGVPVKAVTGIAVSGQWLFFTYAQGVPVSANAPKGPYGWGMVKLGSLHRDGSGATVVFAPTTFTQPLREPRIVGDTLYMVQNLGIATWDLTPTLLSTNTTPTIADLPTFLGGSTNQDALREDPVKLIIDGVFAYLAGGTYRVFDLH